MVKPVKTCPVDNMDHLTIIFSCRRKTNRWPMVLFFNMLDVAGVAAFKIQKSLNPDWYFNDQQGRRQKFLKHLGQELTSDYTQVCLQTQSCLKSNVRNALKMIGKLDDLPQPAPAAENRPRKHCRLCPTCIILSKCVCRWMHKAWLLGIGSTLNGFEYPINISKHSIRALRDIFSKM